jgi:hypothetical protein
MHDWFAGKTSSFLNQACTWGYRLLAGVEKHAAEQQKRYAAYQALFEHRHEGHYGADRRFASAAEFFDFSGQEGPRVLLPGLDTPQESTGWGGWGTIRAVARSRLGRALSNSPLRGFCPGERLSDAAIRHCEQVTQGDLAQRLSASSALPSAVSLSDFAEAGELEPILLLGQVHLSLPWSAAKTQSDVRSSLICGPTSADDYDRATADEAFPAAEARLVEAALTKSGADFDRWHKNVRQHACLALVGATRRTGKAREQAERRGKRIYCALLWRSYRMMSRCYGMLMYCANQALRQHASEERRLRESWVFGQMHRPQVYLAGLPLDFFGPAQFRWIWAPLMELWESAVVDCQRYDFIPALLGIHGTLHRDKRAADRAGKARRKANGAARVDVNHLPERTAGTPEEPCDDEVPRRLSSNTCPTCGGPLKDHKLIEGSDSRLATRNRGEVLVELYCGRCDVRRPFVLNAEDVERKLSRKPSRRR